MIPGVSASDEAAARLAILRGCRLRTRVDVLDRSHRLVDTTERVVSGQISLTNTDTIKRVIELQFADPDFVLGLDSIDLSTGFAGLRYLLAVTQLVHVDDLGRWIGIPCGVVVPSQPTREGDTITMACEDKAALWLRDVPSAPIRKGRNIVTAIRDSAYALGERRFRFPSASVTKVTTGAKDVPLGGPDEDKWPFRVWQSLADKAGMRLLYDLDGYLVLERTPESSAPVAAWDESSLTSLPKKAADLRTLKNRVAVKYKGGKTYTAVLPAADDMSPASLAINGVAAISFARHDKPKYTAAEAKRFGDLQLGREVSQSLNLEFSGLPAWWVRSGDWATVTWAGSRLPVRIDTGTIPLDGSPMSIGYTRTWRKRAA